MKTDIIEYYLLPNSIASKFCKKKYKSVAVQK